MDPAPTEHRWAEGERVRVRGHGWTVGAVTPHEGCASLLLRGEHGAALTVLTPFDRPQRLAPTASRRFVHRRRWLHVVRRAACNAHPFGSVVDPPAGTITLLPYQLEPTLAVARHGATRILIADAVGLGKTIQAGLLLQTLAARHPLLRALVIAPAGLRDQWRIELAERLAIEAVVADAVWLRTCDRALPRDVAPWALPGVFVTSFDFLKRPEVLRPLEDLSWDLLIVDEAHNASRGSARRAAIDAVARRALRVVLLTATPHAGDAAQFDALCALGASSDRDRIVMFRRSRQDAGTGLPRRTVMLNVAPTAEERRLQRLLDRYTAAICRESRARGDRRPRLVATVLKKRALSSAASFGLSVRRRLELLAGAPQASQLLLPLGDEDALEDEVDDATLGTPGLSDAAVEQRLLTKLAHAADAVGAESKPAFLLRLLRRAGEPAIVFTEFRDTLTRLHGQIAGAGHRVTLLHGGLLPMERSIAQRRFNREGGVLLATDAASEGLNLQGRCRLVVHYELPWTPSRLEQRTGRVDRIGQARRVHELLLVAGDAAEQLVLVPLARRAARVRSALGEPAGALERLAERDVADAVLERAAIGEPAPPGYVRFTTMDLVAEAQVEAARLAERRVWRTRSADRAAGARCGGVVVSRGSGGRGSGPVAVYALALASDAGRVEHREIVAVRGSESLDANRVLQALEARVASIAAAFARVQHAVSQRAHALLDAIPSASRALVQAGLFERRAIHLARQRATASARLAEDLGAPAGSRLSASVELIAVLRN